MTALLHEFIVEQSRRAPHSAALRCKSQELSYGELLEEVTRVSDGMLASGLGARDRVAIYLPKRFETVTAIFGALFAGCVFVPVNPLLKPEQVAHILRDCNVRALITSAERAKDMAEQLHGCPDLRQLVLVDDGAAPHLPSFISAQTWKQLTSSADTTRGHRTIDADMAAILYTSGSTGKPKGVVLTHRNMVAGARSVASYLQNTSSDRLLAVLPLSFDAGFSQLTTAFSVGACAVLMDYLLPLDVLRALDRERITGLTAVPPLYIQLASLNWPASITEHLRYFANTGGAMPRATLARLRHALPKTKPFLMYGLTEAFRSTYLPPSEVDRRPDSIGKAIPNAEILVVRPDGSPCEPDEPGELVHRGALVAAGYWNDPEKTAERFRAVPGQPRELVIPEMAVWSGDTVRKDADGFLYFVARRDEMIKTSGYRVSPTEVEEVLYASGMVADAVVVGVRHELLGNAIVAVVSGRPEQTPDTEGVLAECRRRLPNFMIPAEIIWRATLPRNPNGKFDRKLLSQELADLFADARQ